MTLAEIAKRAGVTKGTIYLYFDGKEAVFKTLVRETIGATLASFGEMARELEQDGVRSELRNDSTPGIGQVLSFSDDKGTTSSCSRTGAICASTSRSPGSDRSSSAMSQLA